MISTLTTTSHCKKINCCSILFNGNINSSISYFATAGEDNVININSLDTKTNQFKVELVLCGHISNISAITVCCVQLYSVCYMVSVGGRSQLMLWRIEIKDQNIICKQMISNFLWPSDGIYYKSRKNTNSFSNEPQIRYLDASISQINEEKYLISTACSDSAFRLFIFNQILNSLTLISITSFNTSCVLKIMNIFTTHIITASSDGTLKIWSLLENLFENLSIDPLVDNQMNLNSVFEMRFHESGINSLDVIQLNDVYLIASGGDDNSLILSLLKSYNNCLNRICFVEEKYVHSSQITGIGIDLISIQF
jgi:WD40 repeat protein